MRAYFSQFGVVTKLRMSRNKRTGKPKHYAFVEFDSAAVADIVARTMNKYLMFNHILEVHVVPQEKLHPDLWKGQGKRFHVVPKTMLQARWLREPKSTEVWGKRVEKEQAKRLAKAEKLKELGYDFEMPEVKSVDTVALANGAEDGEEPKAIEAAPEAVEADADAAEEEIVESLPAVAEATNVVTPDEPKKSKKRKEVEAEAKVADAEPAKKQKVKKSKSKGKKA
jgi:nucleolar protein 15